MTRGNERHCGMGRSSFCLVILLVLLSLAVGCAAPPWEVAVDSPRYDVAHAVWLVSRIRAGADLPGSAYVALYDRAEEALSGAELDRLASVFARLEREQVYSLLAGIDPRNDDWLTASDEAGSEEIDLMRLAWDRFLRDWDAHNWQAMRESALVRHQQRLRPIDNPFKPVVQLLDVSLPKPHVLFYMPSALGDPPSGVSPDSLIYRLDAGYVLTGENVSPTYAVAEYALLASWLGGGQTEETLLQMARHWSDWEYVSSWSSREDILTQARDRVFWVVRSAVMVRAGLFDPTYLELGSIWEQDWPGLATLLVHRVNQIWQSPRKLTEDDVLEVMRTWLAQNP